MSEPISNKFSWWLPICGSLGAVILLLPTLIWGNDAGAFFASIPLAALIIAILLIVAMISFRRHRSEVLWMAYTFLILAFTLFKFSDYLRTTTRWLVYSKIYKAQVLDQPPSPDGSLKHMEWDGWGFAGAGDTTVYLVLDSSDQLDKASKQHSSGKFSGIPCEAVRVHRLESHWYTVLFYTDTDWNHCT